MHAWTERPIGPGLEQLHIYNISDIFASYSEYVICGN